MSFQEYLELTLQGKTLTRQQITELLYYVLEIFIQEPTLLTLSTPINICGDVHGQFSDVKYLFSKGGPVANTKYLFLGDYVDRGYNSLETITLLLCYKALYPKQIFLLRGNHECRMISGNYGFMSECERKLSGSGGNNNIGMGINIGVGLGLGNYAPPGRDLWNLFMECFDNMPLAAVVTNNVSDITTIGASEAKINEGDGSGTVTHGVYCVHGGLSPLLPTLDSVRLLNRFSEIPPDGPIADMLWSDPATGIGVGSWVMSPRGAGYMFGVEPAKTFLNVNGLSLIARAHQTAQEGYDFSLNNNVVTVWSAPNYCYRCGNKASIMCIDDAMRYNFIVFEAVPDNERTIPLPTYMATTGYFM